MATTSWTGASDGDPTSAANWSGNVPSATDDAFIPRNATVNMDGGTLAGQIPVWEVEHGCRITIGGVGSPVVFSANELIHRGQGATYYQDNSGPTVNTVIACGDRDGFVQLLGDTYTNVICLRGRIVLGGTIGTVTELLVAYVSDMLNDCKVTLTTAMTGVTRAYQKGGVVTSAVAIGDLVTAAGSWSQQSSAAITRVHPMGGTVYYETSGTLADGFVFPGATLDLLNGLGATPGGVRTVTDLYRLPGCTVKQNVRGVGNAIANDYDYTDIV